MTMTSTYAAGYSPTVSRRRGYDDGKSSERCPAASDDDPYLPCVANRMKVFDRSIRQMLNPADAAYGSAHADARSPATSRAPRRRPA